MQPMVEVRFAWFTVLLVLVVASLVVAGILYAIQRGHAKAVLMVGGTMLGLFLVAALTMSGVQKHREDSRRVELHKHLQTIGHSSHRPATQVQRAAMEPSTPTIPSTLAGPTPKKIEHLIGSSAPLAVAELPAWRKNPPREGSTEQGWSKYVLSSQQFATIEEAEAELFRTVIADVQSGFAHHWPETRGWVPTREDVISSSLITEKVIETFSLKVGEFENPVYRVSWLVQFRPEANQALHARWSPLEAERRSHWILGILAGATGLLGVAATMLRKRAQQSPEPAASGAEYPLVR